MIASIALLLATVSVPAWADPQSVHEITANWVGDPLPTEAPFGQPVTAEFHVNTNDTQDPYSNAPVANVRATLTAGNGVFTSIPPICKTSGVTPVSEISADGTTLLCNLGTIDEGTASVIQAAVRANSTQGGDLTVTGTATSDTAVAEAGPADAGPLPITYVHGMDLSLAQAPGQTYQGILQTSRLGGNRPFIQMNYSLILTAGSRPGPVSYSFPVSIGANIAGATTGLTWEGCVPVGDGSASTGQPFSEPTKPDRTNFPTCSVSGSGTSYTVTLSNLDYTLVNTPTTDSLGQALPGSGVYIASGTVRFSIPAQVTAITNYTFSASPGQFVFDDGATAPDANAGNNASTATLQPPGWFANRWMGSPTSSRSYWDANLWVSPGTSSDIPLPMPGIDTPADWEQAVADNMATGSPDLSFPLYMQADSQMWLSYQGTGGPQMAGICTMSQNPAFVITSFEGGGWSGAGLAGYHQFATARYFYTTQVLNTKTETCGQPAPSAMWTEITPPPGTSLTDPHIASDILMQVPAGVTAVKMTWDPSVDRYSAFLRAFGHIDPAAPTTGEGWTVGAFNSPYDPATTWPGWPALNGWVNLSTEGGGTVIPGSTYGPNSNAYRDAFRLQGAQGLIEKAVSDTSALPGVPITYTLRAEAQNLVTSPPPATFTVVDTLPVGLVYVPGTGSPAPTSVSADGRTLIWAFTNVAANVFHEITYQAQRPVDSVIAPGTQLTNFAAINVVGDNRPANTPGRQAWARVTVPAASATVFGKSTEANVLSFEGDSSAWRLTIDSRDPFTNAFTDTIDILPAVGDGRGTNIDGTYTVTGVTAPAGSTVYYTSAPLAALSLDSRDPSNGGTPGSVSGNTVGWSTTPIDHPTAIRVIGPALAPGATQTIRILYSTPAGSNCEAPAAGDNKAGQILVNSAGAYAGHTALPMLSSATTQIGNCYAANLKKYVQDADGQWHDANTIADYPTFHPGDAVRYRVVIENTGQGPLTGIVITDDKQPQLGSFTVDELAPGASETHEYTITLPADAAVGIVNTVSATTDTPPDVDEPPTIPSDPAGIEVANYTVAKTADPASGTGVLPGDTITYTITVTQQGTAAAAASWQDDLAGLLDDAAYNGDAVATIGTVSLTGDVLEWSGTLQPGETATITYSVTVNAAEALGDGLVTNVVFSPGCTDGCETEHPVRFVVQIEKLGEAEDASWVRMDGSVFELLEDLNGQPGGVLAAPTPIEIALGLFEVSGIQPGTYWLRETAAPAGFSLLAQPVQFTVHPHGTVTIDANGGDVVTAVGNLITVRDVPAMELPEAGGAGTFIFSAIGALTLVAALTMALVLRRRRQHRTREEVTGTHEPS